MPRPRKNISLKQKLAAALASLLPPEVEKELRGRHAAAEEVIALFQCDHIVLHALDGSDLWWNLHHKLTALHREKSKRDTSIVAKVKRIEPVWQAFTANMAKPDKGRSARRAERKRGPAIRGKSFQQMRCLKGAQCFCDRKRRKRCGNYRG